MSAPFGFVTAILQAEAALVEALGLRPLPLPPELAAVEGAWSGRPALLRARAWTGPRVRYARVVTIEGDGLEIGNALLLSEPDLPLPMLGVDLVGLGRTTGVVVADLSPVPAHPDTPRVEAARRRAAGLASPGAGAALPPWCRQWFSPHALCARISADRSHHVPDALSGYCEAFVALAREALPAPVTAPAVEAWQRAYCRAHREDDHGLRLLSALLGAPRAERLLHELLFPTRLEPRQEVA